MGRMGRACSVIACSEQCGPESQRQVGEESNTGSPAVGSKMRKAPELNGKHAESESSSTQKARTSVALLQAASIALVIVGGANIRTERCSSISKQPPNGVAGHAARGICRTIRERRGVVEGRGVVGACRASLWVLGT